MQACSSNRGMIDSTSADGHVAGAARRGSQLWNGSLKEDVSSLPRRLRALIALAHPVPSFGTALAAVVAALPLVANLEQWQRVFLLFVSVLFQQVAISVHNDWCDLDLDRAAKPGRALPAGMVGGRTTLMLIAGSAGASVLMARALGWDMVVLVVIGLAAGLVYNAHLKRTPLSWVPFAVAFPLIPLFGMAALDRWTTWWWTMYVVPLPSIVAIHLTDALPDYEHDAAMGVDGLAQFLGKGLAAKMAMALAGLSALAVGALGSLLPRLSPLGTSVAQAGFCGAAALIALGAINPRMRRATVTAGAAVAALAWAVATALT